MNPFFRRLAAVLIVVFFAMPAFGQGWFNTYETAIYGFSYGFAKTPAGGYLSIGITGEVGSKKLNSIRTNSEGEFTWVQTDLDSNSAIINSGAIVEAQGGGYLVGSSTTTVNNGEIDCLLYKVTESGEVAWISNLGNFSSNHGASIHSIKQDFDGNIYMLGQSVELGIGYMSLRKVSEEGELIWATLNWETGGIYDLDLTSDGYILVGGKYDSKPYFGVYNQETGAEVNFVEVSDSDIGLSLTIDNNDDIVYLTANYNTEPFSYSITRIEYDGTIISSESIPFIDYFYLGKLRQLPSGEFFILGQNGNSIQLMRTNEAGNEIIWSEDYGYLSPGFEHPFDLVITDDEGCIVSGRSIENGLNNNMFLAKFDSQGNIYTNSIIGVIANDTNGNCQIESTELPLNNWIVELSGDNGKFYDYTNAAGEYEFLVDEGDYGIQVYTPNELWESNCTLDTITIAGNNTEAEVNLPIQIAEDCNAMTVDIGVTDLRRCSNRSYWVNYCNSGTQPAEEVTIEIQIDDSLQIVSTSIDPISQDGNFLTFDIGEVGIGECGSFSIGIYVPCDVTFAYMHCSSAHIYPNEPCGDPDPNWSGASIEVRGECENNELVRFEIENVGTAPMASALDFVIIEDEMILLNGDFDLGPNEIAPYDLPATGGTYIINAEQELNHPGFSMPTTFVQGCGGLMNTFIVNWMTLDDVNIYYDEDCTMNTDSYDPNEKIASPRGWGEANLLEPNIDLEYQINFQNEGNDTAFVVVVLDTLPATLDFSTFREATSSYPYVLELASTDDDLPVLKYTFTGINLLPKSWDEPASQGFLKYSIAQQPDLEIGTVIQNRAGIYFDFNAPVMTEYAFHTIGIDFIEIVDVKELSDINLIINIAPNPTFNQAIVTIPELQNTTATLYLNDAIGKRVQTVSLTNGRAELNAESLTAGIYFLQIVKDNALIGTAKLIVR